ncbi:M23 family metallopeptidase [Cellulomonas fimi]|uniref:murein hydrolase activator EnvC family protein n=1 Tax=Cellulomonas fimi TaxID=1708 RepID=UPI00234C11C9|nr:M23 family metallopeptidase [Cellulomonas fimi]MDC7123772.1 M23 family metallopeptidase [Cellulomonas fimi]
MTRPALPRSRRPDGRVPPILTRRRPRPRTLLLAIAAPALLLCTAATPLDAAPRPADAERPAVAAPPSRWEWPLVPPVEVLAPFEAPPAPWAAGHRGVDLRAGPGVLVGAPATGTVTFVGPVAGRGVVTVTHDDGLRSSVEPVAALVVVGARVAPGDPLGTVEPTGGHCAATACLHWGVRRGDVYVDPVALVEGGPIVLLPTD